MIHIRNECKALAQELKKPWNQMILEAEVEGSDLLEEGEQTPEQKAAFDQDYCCMIIELLDDFSPPNSYTKFDESAFWKDFTGFLQKRFGSDVTITRHEGCHEFEFQRVRA
jgi:hypothetical protein